LLTRVSGLSDSVDFPTRGRVVSVRSKQSLQHDRTRFRSPRRVDSHNAARSLKWRTIEHRHISKNRRDNVKALAFACCQILSSASLKPNKRTGWSRRKYRITCRQTGANVIFGQFGMSLRCARASFQQRASRAHLPLPYASLECRDVRLALPGSIDNASIVYQLAYFVTAVYALIPIA
jgi:hypothetical protein